MVKLSRKFFLNGTVTIAKKLIGKYIIKNENGVLLAGRIVETEAYKGCGDPGSHAYRKRTKRNCVMFGAPGAAYVYFCYGNHFLFNIVTEKKGTAGAVLIRALEPVAGMLLMMKRRKTRDIEKLSSGPGKWTQAFGIGRNHNKLDLINSRKLFVVAMDKKKFTISSGPRIGIKKGLDKKWRFFIKGNRFVSKS